MTTNADNFLAHYGVLGMKWGVRKNSISGVSTRTSHQAKKDAVEFSKAKMFYGEGAGTRRKLIKAKVEAKSTKDPSYKKAFDQHLASQDMGKRAAQARTKRARVDASNSAKKTSRGVYRLATGGMGSTTIAAGAIFAGYGIAKKTGIDKTILSAGAKALKYAVASKQAKAGADFLKNL